LEVLFFHRSNDYTGSTRALANMIQSEYNGQNVIVVTIDIKGIGFLSELSNVKISKVYYPLIKGKRIKFISYFISTLHLFLLAFKQRTKIDTFYINTINPYPAAIVGRLLKKKIIYHVHEKFVDNGLEQRLLEFIFNHTKSTRIFVSNYVKNQYPASINPSIVKYNKLSPVFVSNVKLIPINQRSRNHIIMISSLSVIKGVYQFVALAKVMPTRQFTLIVNANDNEISSFFKDKNDLPINLNILPAQSDIHPFLSNADLLLNLSIPSMWIETFGLTIIEAMAYGIPAIVPNVGGPLEIVTDGYNGYCVDVTDIAVLQQKIEKCFADNNYEHLATGALQRIKDFS
jgi:glycosyltransferase involved in cell wall biosynthesis